eukprot:1007405-Pyramimonas_sp.AAC.1
MGRSAHARVVARACRNPSQTFGAGRISQSSFQKAYTNTGFRNTDVIKKLPCALAKSEENH